MYFAFFSMPDMMVIMAFALVIFGPKRLPEVGRQVGTLMRDMRKMMGQFTDAVESVQSEFKPVVNANLDRPPYAPVPDEDLMKPYDQREGFLLKQTTQPLSLSTLPPLSSEKPERMVPEEETTGTSAL